jgi:hypothetical protein
MKSGVTGTASCSARACHGSLEPFPESDGVQRNEHTTWLTQDRHANAYRVLLTKRSQDMVARLGYKPAHEESHCLVCHSNPALASDESPLGHEEQSAGVSCETCHGAAEKWLDSHTSWFHRDAKEKQRLFKEYGMTWLHGPQERAELCVRCHVGIGPSSDVNHDLIAAGHPRLEFELTAFLANMPKHWIERTKKPNQEMETWIVGQVETARAGLQLLIKRASDPTAPWPEFAEYDCFACHHDLGAKSWRREGTRFEQGLTPGTVRWNDRYLSLLPGVVGEQSGLADPWLGLVQQMAKPLPDRSRVEKRAGEIVELLDWPPSRRLLHLPGSSLLDEDQLSKGLIEFATCEMSPARSSWDAAAQVYLALAALRPDANAAASQALKDYSDLLAFPPGMNSPGTYRENEQFDMRLRKVLARIRTTFLSQR